MNNQCRPLFCLKGMSSKTIVIIFICAMLFGFIPYGLTNDRLTSGELAKEKLSNVQENIDTKVGEGRLKVYLWSIYDAELFSTNGRYEADKPHLLRLTYLRDISTKQFANRAMVEMKKQGVKDKEKLEQWSKLLMDILPNVTKADSISVATDGVASVTFWFNNEFLYSLEDKIFKQNFLNIWLSENASFSGLRNKLTNTTEY